MDKPKPDKGLESSENANMISEVSKPIKSVISNKLPRTNHEKETNSFSKPSTKPIGKVAPFSETRNKFPPIDGNSDTSKPIKGLRVRSFAVDPAKVWAEKHGVKDLASTNAPQQSRAGEKILIMRNERFIVMPKPLIQNR